jgi:DNA mismatch repair protein MutL
MTKKIHTLDPLTINQIAAGEVIENTSSVIKELVDNALDAGANEIFIETENGGRTRLVVEDNGHGMDSDCLLLSVERYATSKIRSAEDLIQVKSMGFRGEALASITSVSKVKLISSEQEGLGALLKLCGGEVVEQKPHPRKKGTTIEVCDLFYNTPVRRSFQKAPARDVAAIHRLLTQYILSRENVGFKWVNQGESVLDISKDLSLQERLEKVLGDSWAVEAMPVKAENDELKVRGFIAPEHAHRANRLGQYFFINGRPLASPFLSHQLLLSFATRLPKGRFPQAVLLLDIPFHWVDVNVHPQKKEVRLREEERLGFFLKKALDSALGSFELKTYLPPKEHFTPADVLREPAIRFSTLPKEPPQEILPPKVVFEKKAQVETTFSQPLSLLDPFLLVAAEKGVWFVHLGKMHSHLIKMELEKNASGTEKPSSQGLLIPITLTFDREECAHLEGFKEKCAAYGLQYSCKETQVLVKALPSYLKENRLRTLLENLLEHPLAIESKELVKSFVQGSENSSFTYEEGKRLLKECEKRGIEWRCFAHLTTAEEIYEHFK